MVYSTKNFGGMICLDRIMYNYITIANRNATITCINLNNDTDLWGTHRPYHCYSGVRNQFVGEAYSIKSSFQPIEAQTRAE